jgi:hypothetical protein
MAARMDRLAIVRSMHHDAAPIHETGFQLLQTGRLCRAGEEYPHFGSVVARLIESQGAVPPFVVLPGRIQRTGIEIPHGQSAGCLGPAYAPFILGADPTALGFDAGSTCDLQSERRDVRESYGRTTLGRSCLLARRLVEAGSRVIVVNMFETVFNHVSWDCHGAAPFSTLSDYARTVLPTFDQAFTALVDDLEERGLLDTTLVVATGEFGRTPRRNPSGGRDHWPGVWSVVLAGGGIQGGQVVGASDAHAGAPVDRPVTPQDLLATIYHSLGIDRTRHLAGPDGRSSAIIADGEPIHELFA